MPVGEQRRRIRDMQRTICTQTVDKWAADFLEELDATRRKNERLRRKRISVGTTAAVRAAYGRAKRRLLLFDYDGTLAGPASPSRGRRADARTTRPAAQTLRGPGQPGRHQQRPRPRDARTVVRLNAPVARGRARRILQGGGSLAQEPPLRGVGRRAADAPATVRRQDAPRPAGDEADGAGMALPPERRLARLAPGAAARQSPRAALLPAQTANHAGRQGRGDQVPRLHERARRSNGSSPPNGTTSSWPSATTRPTTTCSVRCRPKP